MAYGSGCAPGYAFLYAPKNCLPCGGYFAGSSVATVHWTRDASEAGVPPCFGSVYVAVQMPSGPRIFALGMAAARSLVSCTALLFTMPLMNTQSVPFDLIDEATERSFAALGSQPVLPSDGMPCAFSES